jgi:hypothetical protein
VPQRQDPSEWLKLRLPLLSQYLESHQLAYPFRVFGISAQGGDWSDPKEKLRLGRLSPEKRISIAGVKVGEAETNDISYPIRWLML